MKPITDNELIAEFMGARIVQVLEAGLRDELRCYKLDSPPKGLHDLINNCGLFHTALQFDTSWSWLMPVVEKIVQIKGSHFIYDHTVLEIFMYGKRIVRIGDATMIGNYYNGVVEFIKWYNTHKNENI